MNYRAIYRFLVVVFAFSSHLSADLLYLASTSEMAQDGVTVLDATTFLPTSPFFVTTGSPRAIAVNPDGTLVYMSATGTNNLFVMHAGPPLSSFSGSPFPLVDETDTVVVSPKGVSPNLLYVPVRFGTFYVFDAHTLAPYMASPYMMLPYLIPTSLAINPAGTFVYLADTTLVLYKIDALTLTSMTGPTLSGASRSMVVSPDGTRLYAATINGTVEEFDAVTLTSLGSHPTGGMNAEGIVITPDGNRLFITNAGSNTISVLDAHTFAPIVPPFSSQGTNPQDIVINVAGTRVYALNETSNTIIEIDAINPAVIGTPHDTGTSASEALAIFSLPPIPPPPVISVDPPTQLMGFQQKNDFGCAFELFNTLQWDPSPTNGVTGYNIYRDGSKIATLNASTLQYEDHNRPKGVTTFYAVTAFADTGESAAVNVAVQ